MADARTGSSRTRAAALLADAAVCDMVFVYEPDEGCDARLFPRWAAAGFNFVSVHPAGDRHNVGDAVKRIARARRDILAEPSRYMLVETVEDITAAQAAGKLAVGLHLEGFRPLERELSLVEVYYQLGIRFCHPIFNLVNEIGGGCADREDIGLTTFGLAVVAEMNRVGMIVDCSHAGYRSTLDMMEASQAPVLFSHVACADVHPHLRNATGEQIRRCAATGGIVGITSAGYYLGGTPSAERFFRHIDHIVQTVGPAHVGLGLDYCENVDWLRAFIAGRPGEWPGADQGLWEPVEFMPPEALAELVEIMCGAGYDDGNIRGILGENFLGLCAKVWK